MPKDRSSTPSSLLASTPQATESATQAPSPLPETEVDAEAADLNRPEYRLERELDQQLSHFSIDGPSLKNALLDHFRHQSTAKAIAEVERRSASSLRLKGHHHLLEQHGPSDYLKALASMFNDSVATQTLTRLSTSAESGSGDALKNPASTYEAAAVEAVQKRLASGAAQVDVSNLLSVAALPYAHQGSVGKPKSKMLWRVQSLQGTWKNNLPEAFRVYYQMLARLDLDPAAARGLSPEVLDNLGFARFAQEAQSASLSLPLADYLGGHLGPTHPDAITWWSDSDETPPPPPDAASAAWYSAGFVKLGFKPKDLSLREPTVYDTLVRPEPEGDGQHWVSTGAIPFKKASSVALAPAFDLLKPAVVAKGGAENPLPADAVADPKNPPRPRRRARNK